MSTNAVRATLAYDGFPPIDFKALESDISRIFRNIMLQFDQTEAVLRKHVNFIGEKLCLSITRDKDDILVWVEDGVGINSADEQTKLAACYHVVRHLLSVEHAESVYWHYTGKCYTSEGFEARIALEAGPIKPRANAVAEAVGDNIFDEDFCDVDGAHARLDDCLVRKIDVKRDTPVRKIKSKAARFAPIAETLQQIEAFDDAKPRIELEQEVRERLRAALYPEGRPDFVEDDKIVLFGPGRPDDRLDKSETTARLATYAINTTLLITAMPVGAALMTYNILGGENFRLTAHVTALTGAFLGTSWIGGFSHLAQMI